MAAKKKSKKKVTITLDLETFEKLLDALATLGDPGQIFEHHVDDPELARKLTKRRAKKKRR